MINKAMKGWVYEAPESNEDEGYQEFYDRESVKLSNIHIVLEELHERDNDLFFEYFINEIPMLTSDVFTDALDEYVLELWNDVKGR